MKDKKSLIIVSIISLLIIFFATFLLSDDDELKNEVTKETIDTISSITTYEMTESDISELPTTEILEQTEEDENAQEQEVESEAFEEQGEIAYNGSADEYPSVTLGNYTGLTYYSQLDSRWASKTYTSCGNSNQTIGTSGCAPTTASMIVTAIKGTITPPEMANLFVQYGYRSSNNGTYLSAFRFVADTFDLEYQEAENFDQAIELLRNNHYVAVSCANGLFTTGGHLILLYGIDGDTIKIYDPYLYSRKIPNINS